MSAREHGLSAVLPGVPPVEHTVPAAELRAVGAVTRNSSVVVGRDALGNVFITGDGNTVEVKLTVVAADMRLRAPDPSTLQNPYRGLDAFRETDSAMFFGREDLVRRLWTRFHGLQRGQAPRLLPILGASGSGKSSLVRAGLLPELVRQPMEGMRRPMVLVLRPGANPLQRLADVLSRLAPDDLGHVDTDAPAPPSDAVDTVHRAVKAVGGTEPRVVFFVDQFEELFTECTSETTRSAFLATLAHAVSQPCGVVSVVFAMRNDFAGSLRAYSAFADAVREQRFTVSPMSRDQLVDAIEQPAKMLGHPWPSGLVENLVLQCEGRSGALPLLQFALKRLWSEQLAGRLAENRWPSQLIEDFVVQVAEELMTERGVGQEDASRERILQRAFVAMVQLGEGTADTRRVARLSEIVARGETREQVRAVLAPFAAPEARLVTASEIDGEPSYELAHEAMIGSWGRLREWLGQVARKDEAAAIRSELRLRRRLRHAAEVWNANRDARREALWRPPELELVSGLRDRDPEELPALEYDFIDASLDTWKAHDRWRRRVRSLGIGAAAVFVVVVSIMVLLARDQANNAQRAANNARDQTNKAEASDRESRQRLAIITQSFAESGRQLVMEGRFQEAVPYLLEARRKGINSPALRMMFGAAARHLPLLPALEHQHALVSAAFSPDGTRVVTASDTTASVWDLATGILVTRPLAHEAAVRSAAFSPDGTRVVTASGNAARVWDAATGKLVTGPLEHPIAEVTSVAFSPDGTRVVTTGYDATARVWDVATGTPVTDPLAHHRLVVYSAAFSPDGTRVVTAGDDFTARVWNATTGEPVTRPLKHHAEVVSAAFSPDGTRVVTASYDGTARVWNAVTGTPVTRPLAHQGDVVSAAFSPDGTRVVTASKDKTARVWNAATGRPVTRPLAHRGDVNSAAFSPDGTRVVTASYDGTAQVWDAATGRPVTDPLEHQGYVASAAFSPDGNRVVTASGDKTARVWDTAPGTPVTRRLEHQGKVLAAAFSPNGTRVVTTSYGPNGTVYGSKDNGTARVWNAITGEPVTPPLASGPIIRAAGAAFSPDGNRVVTASYDTARVWDATTGTTVVLLEYPNLSGDTSAAFSPDGTRIVTASGTTARVWDAATGTPVTDPLEDQGGVVSAAFSPDGTRVITAGYDGTARVWDVASNIPVIAPLKHQAAVKSAAFSPDGTRVVTASDDHTARVWDAATGNPVTPPLEHVREVVSAAFSPDGTHVVTASADHTARVWNATTGEPVTPPLEHQGGVASATFSPDGTRVVTASDYVVCIWDVRLDEGTLEQWTAIAERSPFVLSGAAFVRRVPRPTSKPAD